MTDFIFKSIRKCIVGGVIFAFAIAYAFHACANNHEKVATVNNTPIYLSDIIPELEKESSEILKEQKTIEALVSKIRNIIQNQQEERYHINPDTTEIQREWKIYEPMFKKISDRFRPKLKLTYEALTKVYDKGEDADQVYNELLKHSDMSLESWKSTIAYYKSDKRREDLKRQLNQQNLGWDKPLPDFKSKVIDKEMNKVIDEQLIKDDPIFAYFKKVLPDYYISWDLFGKEYKNKEVDALTYIRNSRNAWWRKVYQQSQIVIIDEKYQKAKNIVLAKPSEHVLQAMAQLRIKYAQPVPHHFPTATDSNIYKSPPNMPVFDKQNVQHLIDTIEEPQHAMILKVGFFGSHMKRTLSKLDGFNLLIQALNKTEVGTLRWFLIQSVLGFSDYDNPHVTNNYWMHAYQEIFNNINLANTPQKNAVLYQSIRDVVYRISVYTGSDKEMLRKVLLNAWKSYKQFQITDSAKNINTIDWSRAVKAANAQDEFTSIVEDALKDTTHTPDFQMLKLAITAVPRINHVSSNSNCFVVLLSSSL